MTPSTTAFLGRAAAAQLLVLLFSCHSPAPTSSPAAKALDPSANDAARFLAGLPGRVGSPYRRLEKSPEWIQFAREFDAAWEKAEAMRLRAAREFSVRELSGMARGETLFYPFSGPDIVYAQLFFPQARTYVLAGLERPGAPPEPTAIDAGSVGSLLAGVRRGVDSLLWRSFFVTGEMSRHLRRQDVNGVSPVLLLLLARTGNEVDSLRRISLSPSGEPVLNPTGDGLEIGFHAAGGRAKRVLYFRGDLGAGLKKDAPLFALLRRLGKTDTLMKSASFLPHTVPFQNLREEILSHSGMVLQDDTGIPLRILRARGWDVHAFGAYSRPDPPFQRHLQPDLAALFEVGGTARPLGFAIGYGTGRRPTHLIAATAPAQAP